MLENDTVRQLDQLRIVRPSASGIARSGWMTLSTAVMSIDAGIFPAGPPAPRRR